MMKEKDNQLLLTSIYQNTQTALQSFDNILPKVKNNALVEEIKKQTNKYASIAEECKEIAQTENLELTDNNLFEKIKLWSSINMNTMMDSSTINITEMLLFGTFMGIVQCLKDFSKYKNCNENILELLRKLQTSEESNLEALKMFI